MDLGLGNLIELKRHLLPPGMVSQTTLDTLITSLGKGVAAACEQYCARKFSRVVGATDLFTADRTSYILNRYPIESISAVEIRQDVATGFVSQTVNDVIMQRQDAAGMIHFGFVLGAETDLVRVTFTGGFWYDTTEDGSGSLPSGATALPQDLRFGWLQHCKAVFTAIEKVGGDLVKSGGSAQFVTNTIFGLKLSPDVEQIWQSYRRLQLN